ncbi:hypothetical protein [Arthrobacter sp. EpRS71]|uniref:hypothetical protein n=1 Tax=Arthrobacter sp. EpRS71 TaxID=1743141 RepID=UPI000785CAAD|nr:hypothetical protein [Arthrobacter sp. EpRS71]
MRAMAFEQDKDEWHEDAVATIVGLANAHEVFSADDLRREMREPDEPSWPGRAIIAAKKAGHIEPVGYQTSHAAARKYGATRVWRKKTS